MKFLEMRSDKLYQAAVSSIKDPSRMIVCGDVDGRETLEEQLEFAENSPEEIILNAGQINPQEWLRERLAQYKDDDELDEEAIAGEWPSQIQHEGFILDKDLLTGKPLEKALVAHVDVDESWHILAHFKYGGWNDCPDPAVHCAIWKYWEKKYDAHIIGVSGDTIEAKVLRPPSTKEEAMSLAWEQFLYCNDIIDQGVQTISNLAANLQNHDLWFFWWD